VGVYVGHSFEPEKGYSRIVAVRNHLAAISRRCPLHRCYDLWLEDGNSPSGPVTVYHLEAREVSSEGFIDRAVNLPQHLIPVLPGMDHVDMMDQAVGSRTNRHLALRADELAEGFDLDAAIGAFGIRFHGSGGAVRPYF